VDKRWHGRKLSIDEFESQNGAKEEQIRRLGCKRRLLLLFLSKLFKIT